MALQFKIQLKNITDPRVWRRLLVPGQFNFLRFHKLIQVAFGWEDYHLFQFSPKGYGSFPMINIPNPEDDFMFHNEKPRDATKTKLSEIFTMPKQKFIYIYDFGDDWKHEIILEKITDEKLLRAGCLNGKGACPPEDCGGPWGYEDLKIVLNDPKDPEYYDKREWLGLTRNKKWNADTFDLEETKKKVAKI